MELGPHKDREKLTHSGQSFPLTLCGSNSNSSANTHMVSMSRKLALHITLYDLVIGFFQSQPFLESNYNEFK